MLKIAIAGAASVLIVGAAQAQSLKSQLVGAYTLSAVYDVLANGKKNDTWGAGVKGLVIYDSSGMFSVQTYGADRKAEPNKGPRDNVVGPFVTYYGIYTVDETKKTITYHIDQASFPGWNNFDRTVTIDELSATDLKTSARNSDPKLGGEFVAHSELKRVQPK